MPTDRSDPTAAPLGAAQDAGAPADRAAPRTGAVLTVVAAGGVLGAWARYGAGLLWPTPLDGFPWTTLGINLIGCAAMGMLVVLVTEVFRRPLLRPFLGTGVLGGFTTFSTYVVDAQQLVVLGRAGTAATYLVATLLGAVAATWVAATLTAAVVRAARVGGGDRP